MSALRWNPPGQPVMLIDLGPARARLTDGRASLGGPIDYTRPLRPTAEMRNLERFIDSRRALGALPKPVERCGKFMAGAGVPCGRRAGHQEGDCRTPEAVERDTARRRARHR